MGLCTRCGFVSIDGPQGGPVTPHVCSDNKRDVMKSALKLLYDVIVYADPASTAGQKSAALTRIQAKRAWIETNAAELQELLS